MTKPNNNQELIKLAKRVVRVLETNFKCDGEICDWDGFENGNGRECGKEIDRLIINVKRILKNHENNN